MMYSSFVLNTTDVLKSDNKCYWCRSKTSAEEARLCKSPTLSHSTGTASLPGAVGKSQKEPSVDFELDVKVDIESGKCTLHPKEPKTDAESEPRR